MGGGQSDVGLGVISNVPSSVSNSRLQVPDTRNTVAPGRCLGGDGALSIRHDVHLMHDRRADVPGEIVSATDALTVPQMDIPTRLHLMRLATDRGLAQRADPPLAHLLPLLALIRTEWRRSRRIKTTRGPSMAKPANALETSNALILPRSLRSPSMFTCRGPSP